jgi:hypothetical protein
MIETLKFFAPWQNVRTAPKFIFIYSKKKFRKSDVQTDRLHDQCDLLLFQLAVGYDVRPEIRPYFLSHAQVGKRRIKI